MIRIRLVSIFVIAILFIINSETRADNYEYKLTLLKNDVIYDVKGHGIIFYVTSIAGPNVLV